MKRLILSATFICGFLFASAQKNDFRKANWGMASAEVLLTETIKPSANTSAMIVYSTVVGGLPTYAIYSFTANRLVNGAYMFNQVNPNNNKYLTDFENVKQILTELYGKPKLEKAKWTKNLFKDDPDDIGLALKLDHVSYIASWETERTDITLLLGAVKGKISLSCLYKELATSAEAEKVRKEKLKEGF